MTVDLNKVTALLEEVAHDEVLPRFRALAEGDIMKKESGELVTVADVASERFLAPRLVDLLPGSLVVGEEAVDADPSLMEQLHGDQPVWTIDPIDGTNNFAAGRPIFAVMVGLVQGGETRAGWIHLPMEDKTAVAERGAGAWIGETRLRASTRNSLAEMEGTLHASSFAPPEIADKVRGRRDRLNTVKSMSCAGAEYVRLAEAGLDFTLFTRLMPWDHVPGALICEEAGAAVACFDGSPYRAARYREIGVMVAPDQANWRALHATLFDD